MSKLLRLTLLLTALGVAVGSQAAWSLVSECLTECCCGSPIGSASDDCGCEADAPAEPSPSSPWAPVVFEGLSGLELGLDTAPTLALVLPDLARLPVSTPVALVPPPGSGPPTRLLHCSLTI